MALAALISAHHESEAGPLRAILPLAGRTLVERQARLAAGAGCNPIVLLVERIGPELLAAVDRLRREGLPVTIARNAPEAAAAVGDDGMLLLVADGFVADQRHFGRIAGADGPAVLAVPDQAYDDRYERIDAHTRWAGIALVGKPLLQDTAAQIGDWDLISTLLRRAIQGGARELAIRGGTSDGELLIASRPEQLGPAEARVLADADVAGSGWAGRYLLAPVERLIARLLLPTDVTPLWLQLLAALLTGMGVLCFARSWFWPALVLLLLATPLPGVAERLARVRLHPGERRGWWREMLPVLQAAALIAFGSSLSTFFGWGALIVAIAALLFLLALAIETRSGNPPGALWLAEPTGMAWLMLPFAILGYWTTGLGALAAYAAGSFFWAQRAAHPPRAVADQD